MINYNTNSNNFQVIHPANSENINYMLKNSMTEENFNLSKVNVNLPNNNNNFTNNLFNNLYDFKDSNFKSAEQEKNRDLNTKIKTLVDKMKEKKVYDVLQYLIFIKT